MGAHTPSDSDKTHRVRTLSGGSRTGGRPDGLLRRVTFGNSSAKIKRGAGKCKTHAKQELFLNFQPIADSRWPVTSRSFVMAKESFHQQRLPLFSNDLTPSSLTEKKTHLIRNHPSVHLVSPNSSSATSIFVISLF